MDRKRLKMLSWLAGLWLPAGAVFLAVLPRSARNKTMLGAVEDVVLLPWGARVSARIDTGAAISALDAREIKVLSRDEIQFKLSPECGGHFVRRRLAGWRKVKSSDGVVERRPVVNLDLLLGSERLHTPVTLADRSKMEYPLLIGRKTLDRHFTVDVTGERLVPPPAIKEANPPRGPTPTNREDSTR